MSHSLSRAALALASTLAGAAQAATVITLQPDEMSSQDVFVYEFGVPGVFGIPTAARVTNLDTATLSAIPGAVPFGNFLGSANTTPRVGANGETRAHDTRSLLRFDLGLLALSPGQVASATHQPVCRARACRPLPTRRQPNRSPPSCAAPRNRGARPR